MMRKLTICLASVVALGGCSVSLTNLRFFHGPPTEITETYALVRENCFVRELPPILARDGQAKEALTTVLAAGVIEKGVDALINALTRAGQRQASRPFIALANTTFPVKGETLNTANSRCLIIAHGEFTIDGSITNSLSPELRKKKVELQKAGLNFARAPSFYYEGELVYTKDGLAFHVASEYLEYNGRIARKLWDVTRRRDVVLTMEFVTPRDDSKDRRCFGGGEIVLEDLVVGMKLDRKRVRLDSTGWMRLARDDNERREEMPVSVFITVTEARDGNRLLAFAADVLDSKKAALKEEGKKALGIQPPANRE